MIEVDISHVWGEISLPELLAGEKEIFDAHEALTSIPTEEGDVPAWMDLPDMEGAELKRIRAAAERLRSASQAIVVLGIGCVSLAAQAVIELLQGPNRNLTRGKGDPQIFFAGDSFSTRQWNELMQLLEGKDVSLIAVSKSGEDLESAIAFRGLRWLLERRYGTDEAGKRICVVTDPCCGPLHQLAADHGWESFSIPVGVEDRFSALSAALLLPMAAAGVDISAILRGAAQGKQTYDLRSFENPVWLYAGVRRALQRSGKTVELLCSHEPGFRQFGRWWQQLFAGAGEGWLFPGAVVFPGDTHGLNTLIPAGSRNLFETVLRFAPPGQEHTIGSDVTDTDGLNRLAGKNLSTVEAAACEAMVSSHADSGTSVITMDCGTLDGEKVGELLWFMQLSRCLCDSASTGKIHNEFTK